MTQPAIVTEKVLRDTVAATLRYAHGKGTPDDCPHPADDAPGAAELPCEECDADMVMAALWPLILRREVSSRETLT